MQHLLGRPFLLLLIGLATPLIGVGAAWLCARLAGLGRPSPLRITWTIVAGGLLSASATFVRPDELVWSLILGWSLVVLASVDLAVFRLPDILTLPLMLAGLARTIAVDDDVGGHVAGLVAGYVSIAATGWAFMRLRGRRGVGLGDAKLFAAAGAWLGWTALPAVMLIACGLGLAWFAVATLRNGQDALRGRMPFGVVLCCAIWVVWLLA